MLCFKFLMQDPLADVGIDEQGARSRKGEGPGQVGGDGGFSFSRNGTGDEQNFRTRSLRGHVEEGGADVTEGFRINLPFIMGLEQGHAPGPGLGRLEGHLAQHLFLEVVPELGKRIDPVINPVEEEEDAASEDEADGDAGEDGLQESAFDLRGGGGRFEDGNAHLAGRSRDIEVDGDVTEAVAQFLEPGDIGGESVEIRHQAPGLEGFGFPLTDLLLMVGDADLEGFPSLLEFGDALFLGDIQVGILAFNFFIDGDDFRVGILQELGELGQLGLQGADFLLGIQIGAAGGFREDGGGRTGGILYGLAFVCSCSNPFEVLVEAEAVEQGEILLHVGQLGVEVTEEAGGSVILLLPEADIIFTLEVVEFPFGLTQFAVQADQLLGDGVEGFLGGRLPLIIFHLDEGLHDRVEIFLSVFRSLAPGIKDKDGGVRLLRDT